MSTKNSVYIISLGCAKNRVDTEHLLGILKSRGHHLSPNIEEAEIAIVNTCGFIKPAVEETIETILGIADLKKQGKLKKMFVVGCFVQRYGYKLAREIPEVDGWLGTGEGHRIADILHEADAGASIPFHIGRPILLADHLVPRVQTTPFYSAFLRIAEGCSHRCSYCMIPALRGPYRSRDPASLIAEAKAMVSRGVKEINLIAQDTTMFGRDLDNRLCLEDLLENLITIKGIQWIRLLYCHPERISDRLLALMESEEALCPYLDIPQQHVNRAVLKAMGRLPTAETPEQLIERIRSRKRKISLRTTLIVGFPGETEDAFEELYDYVNRSRFEYLGVFTYSEEKGTAAARLRPRVDSAVAQQRLDRIMTLQREISLDINRQMVGNIVPILVEGPSPETDLLLTGRTATMAPDVDSQVLINKGRGVEGEIMPVRITEAHPYDLVGELST
jgi:ribosomal protein S12 methylthiotransferase